MAGSLERYYESLQKRMIAEVGTSELINHAGEQGRSNEFILSKFLRQHLPECYAITNGKVVDVHGGESRQTDIIICDRINNPALVTHDPWTLVPIEAVFGVISVKTNLNKKALQEGLEQIQSVRMCRHSESFDYDSGAPQRTRKGDLLLRPRSLIFAFSSSWRTVDSIRENFVQGLEGIGDEYRPIALCVADKCLLWRQPYTTELHPITTSKNVLFRCFIHFLNSLDTFPRRQMKVPLSRYLADYRNPVGG